MERLRARLDDFDDKGILDWFGFENDGAKVGAFYGALQVERPFAPFKDIAITDEGKLYCSIEGGYEAANEERRTVMFDPTRPNARQQVKRLTHHSIILNALQVRGRRESALAKKEEIEAGCFFAGLEWDQDRALFILDGAKLYDAELCVNPALAPSDLSVPIEDSEPDLSAKRIDAKTALWPGGIPRGLLVKSEIARSWSI